MTGRWKRLLAVALSGGLFVLAGCVNRPMSDGALSVMSAWGTMEWSDEASLGEDEALETANEIGARAIEGQSGNPFDAFAVDASGLNARWTFSRAVTRVEPQMNTYLDPSQRVLRHGIGFVALSERLMTEMVFDEQRHAIRGEVVLDLPFSELAAVEMRRPPNGLNNPSRALVLFHRDGRYAVVVLPSQAAASQMGRALLQLGRNAGARTVPHAPE